MYDYINLQYGSPFVTIISYPCPWDVSLFVTEQSHEFQTSSDKTIKFLTRFYFLETFFGCECISCFSFHKSLSVTVSGSSWSLFTVHLRSYFPISIWTSNNDLFQKNQDHFRVPAQKGNISLILNGSVNWFRFTGRATILSLLFRLFASSRGSWLRDCDCFSTTFFGAYSYIALSFRHWWAMTVEH